MKLRQEWSWFDLPSVARKDRHLSQLACICDLHTIHLSSCISPRKVVPSVARDNGSFFFSSILLGPDAQPRCHVFLIVVTSAWHQKILIFLLKTRARKSQGIGWVPTSVINMVNQAQSVVLLVDRICKPRINVQDCH